MAEVGSDSVQIKVLSQKEFVVGSHSQMGAFVVSLYNIQSFTELMFRNPFTMEAKSNIKFLKACDSVYSQLGVYLFMSLGTQLPIHTERDSKKMEWQLDMEGRSTRGDFSSEIRKNTTHGPTTSLVAPVSTKDEGNKHQAVLTSITTLLSVLEPYTI